MSTTYQKILNNTRLPLNPNAQAIRTIDMHTGGEPLRVIVDGFPELKGANVLEYRRYCRDHYDHLRKALMWEPRGHADMYGCLLVPPNDEGADFGIIFLHNEGYSTMCGHATIAIAKLAVQMGWVEKKTPVTTLKIDAPCGRLEVFVQVEKEKVGEVTFHCVPSFVVGLDLEVEVPELGRVITYDLAYGGAFYAYVDIRQLGLSVDAANYRRHIEQGMAVKRAVMNSPQPVDHPFESDLSFLYGTIFTEPVNQPGVDSRNVCIFADGEVDRCPTGSGVAGRMAIHHRRGDLKIGESMVIESIVGSRFTGSVVWTEDFGPLEAVIPAVSGTAYVTGEHTFLMDPEDDLGGGFLLR